MSTYLKTREILHRFSISRTTLARWLRSPTVGFPRPVTISRRQFFDAAEVAAFEASRREVQK
jgi:predicted DNA-binding transcriptional regulator AlpA